ncbi:MAG: polysaccharide pyruvyl transferase family protein [Kiritimatiellia bacterium]
MKIVVSGAARRMNLGGPSIFHGIVRVFRRVFPECEIVYHEAVPVPPGGSDPDPDHPDVRIVQGKPDPKKFLAASWRCKWLGGPGPADSPEAALLEEIRTADLFVDAWGIEFSDRLSKMNFTGAVFAKPLIRAASWLGVPAVHYTASYGPMEGRWVRMAARRSLGRECSLVYCREEQSKKYLLDCGVDGRKLVVAPDTGFLMPSRPVGVEGLDSARPCLGVSVSHQIVRQWKSPTPYLALIAELCDRAIRQWKAQVLLFPNELSDGRYDDRAVARDVLERVQCKADVRIFPAENHSGPEQKGAMARCDLFVASRYHGIVAAMSMGVPTVVIGWHHKYAELLDHFGQRDVGLSSKNCTVDALWACCERTWSHRQEVRKTISARLPEVERRIYEAGERLKGLFQ